MHIGAQLRAARAARGLTTAAISSQLGVPENALTALENTPLEPAGSAPHTKALLRIYARALDLDPEPLLFSYDEQAGAKNPGHTRPTDFPPPGAEAAAPEELDVPPPSGSRRKAIWITLAVLAAVTVVVIALLNIGIDRRADTLPEPDVSERSAPLRDDREPRQPVTRDTITGLPGPISAAAPEVDSRPLGEGLTVQVLDGSQQAGAAADAAEVLEALGYDVAVTGKTRLPYEHTTVFFNDGHEEDAWDLATVERRIAAVLPNDRDLTSDADLHVVVGKDWRSASPAQLTADDTRAVR